MWTNEFYEGKRVLVTGHTGFKGTWLCLMLQKAGAIVTGYSLAAPTDPSIFEVTGGAGGVHSVIGDIRDLDALNKVFNEFRPEIVFHLAAQPIVRESYKNPVYTYETNVMGTVNLLECVRNHPCVKSVLNVTTDKVYENKEWSWGYRETDVLNGYDPYSNSKSCSELVTASYKKSFFHAEKIAEKNSGKGAKKDAGKRAGKDAEISTEQGIEISSFKKGSDQLGEYDVETCISTARAGNVIGGGDFAPDRIIPDCYRASSKGEPIIVRNPYSVRPFQHVLEPLNVYMEIAQKQWEDPKYESNYNVGPEDRDCVCTGDLVNLFTGAWGEGSSWINQHDGGPHEAGFLKLDCSRVKNTFGWKPVWNIAQAVAKSVEWYKAYDQGEDMLAFTRRQMDEFLADRDS